MECRDYPPTRLNPDDSASGFLWGRNWWVALGYTEGDPNDMNNWFLMGYTTAIDYYSSAGWVDPIEGPVQPEPIKLVEFLNR